MTADCRIRVLHLLGTAHAGGVETFVLELARHIDQRRFDLSVCIVGQHGPIVEALRASGAAVRVLGAQRSFWRQALAYFLYVRAGRFDILHANIGGRLSRYLARIARCRVVITHVHGASDEEVERWRLGSHSLGRRIRKIYLRGTSLLVANSHAVARSLIACCPDLAGRVSIIHYGVDLARFRPASANSLEAKALRQICGLADGDPVVGFIGRLVPQKGLSYLLMAADILQDRYPNLRVVIVGDGPLRTQLQSAVSSLDSKRFYFLGERSDVANLLSIFDVLAVPSEWEAFGIVNLEAMAAAKPVVAFNIDGIPEAIVHGETGLLVPHRDSRALALAIAQLLDDCLLRRRMGSAGRQRVEQYFNVRQMARTFESLYEAVTLRGTA
jgi:glycosyltransferase involved in cell wall biosynthesis